MSNLPLLQVGDVFVLTEEMTIETQVPKHFLYSNCKGDWQTDSGYITPEGFFGYMQGHYVVTKTALQGGSTGHDPYPDGHHVWAQHTENERIRICFYQTGSFRNMHRNVPVVGKAKAQTWTWEKL
ncbi:hypothetical protein selz4t1_21 [Salmonella phage selz]|uniref:Uncharacterized protein n=3 Tax=Kuttervirus TaxID=2169536 RepID=A0A385IT44_9CAUD|nr:hypothetical protein FDI91_gp106 [Salmonella phage STML-13-1]YP_009876495.1 hypothetical protein HYP09_gp181 [Salmonella phage BSP101]YP_009881247.1 hypothetical protein HYP69_gp026 [Salmonella phage SenALZ1]EBI9227119.1 hypothetical protein [Salmonella enterica]EDL0983474.1 hypothetical protein [Salmonella enterica subsp. enterica serovar Typhimurium]EDW4917970.1 hypothetical protein [Salmonella enterica subsp. enterica]QOE31956.1 hypothetical protein ISTP3_orf00149 [Salmonella phage ISTP